MKLLMRLARTDAEAYVMAQAMENEGATLIGVTAIPSAEACAIASRLSSGTPAPNFFVMMRYDPAQISRDHLDAVALKAFDDYPNLYAQPAGHTSP